MSAVGRLHEVADGLATDDGDETVVMLTATEVRALDEYIAELCDDHEECDSCGGPFCATCDVGDDGGCEHGHSLCLGCVLRQCRDCALDARGDVG